MPIYVNGVSQSGGGGGDSSGADKLILATGWSGANHLSSAIGAMNGAAAMTVAALVRLGRVLDGGGSQHILSSGTDFSAGYGLGHLENRPFVEFADGTSSKLSTGGFAPDWDGTPATGEWGMVDWKTALIALRRQGNDLTIFVNMIEWRTITIGAGVTPGATGMLVGRAPSGGNVFGGGLGGIAYVESAVSNDDLRTWMRECMEAVDVVQGSVPWTSRFSFKQLGLAAGAAVPATVEDLVGGNDLTRAGALSIAEERPRWL